MTEVKKIYVIRRSLFGNYNPKIGPWSHSALLLETNNGNFKILEYGVGGNPNSVTLRDVTFKNSKYNDEVSDNTCSTLLNISNFLVSIYRVK